MKKDKNLIPNGLYCYNSDSVCEYWDLNEELAEQQKTNQGCGYCHYLERGDWEYTVPNNAPEKFSQIAISLLWDQVKECGINTEDDEQI